LREEKKRKRRLAKRGKDKDGGIKSRYIGSMVEPPLNGKREDRIVERSGKFRL
jgi:hypothetical protein